MHGPGEYLLRMSTAKMEVPVYLPPHVEDSTSCNALIKPEKMLTIAILYIFYILLIVLCGW